MTTTRDALRLLVALATLWGAAGSRRADAQPCVSCWDATCPALKSYGKAACPRTPSSPRPARPSKPAPRPAEPAPRPAAGAVTETPAAPPAPVAADPAPPRPTPPPSCPPGMVHVPAGTFWMGVAAGEGQAEATPQHRVTLSSYCIDRTEVTVAAYEACAAKGACPPAPRTMKVQALSESEQAFWSGFCNASRAGHERHPINCVDRGMASTYCAWAGGRLPTEAEWEFAARGTDGRTYPWGEEPPGKTRLNATGREFREMLAARGVQRASIYEENDGNAETAPVGSYPQGASPFGVLDMAGNVWEWVADWYGPYVPGEATDPKGPATGSWTMFRGGGWQTTGTLAFRPTFRFWVAEVGYREAGVGFRCARVASP